MTRPETISSRPNVTAAVDHRRGADERRLVFDHVLRAFPWRPVDRMENRHHGGARPRRPASDNLLVGRAADRAPLSAPGHHLDLESDQGRRRRELDGILVGALRPDIPGSSQRVTESPARSGS